MPALSATTRQDSGIATMHMQNRFDNRQPQPCANTAASGTPAPESLEHGCGQFIADSGSIVSYGD